WDTATGKELRNLGVPDSSVRDLTFSPDSKVLALAGQVLLRAWNVSSGKLLWEHYGYREQFFCVAFSPDGKSLAAGLGGGVRRYDAATGRELSPVRDSESMAFVGLFGNGRTVATAAPGKALRLWRLPNAEEVPPEPGRKRPAVPEVADVSRDGKWMASRGHADGAIRIWDIASGKEIRRLPPIRGPFGTFSPDGRWVQSHDVVQNPGTHAWESVLQFWDTRTGKMMTELRGKQASVALFSPDSRLYATQVADRGICCIGSVPDGSLMRTIAVGNGPWRFSFSADGRLLAGATQRDEPPHLWEVASGKEIVTLVGKVRKAPGQSRFSAFEIAFSPNGRTLITCDLSGNLFAWDVEGRLLRQWKGDYFPTPYLLFTPNGKMLISGGSMTALVWNMDEVLPSKKRRRTILTADDLNALWSDLKAEDATRAYRAVWRLAAAPDQAIAFLRERLRPAREPDKTNAERIVQLIDDLDNDTFAVREKASRELATFGKESEPALRKALVSGPSAESKRRIEELLRKLPESLPSPPPEQLRQLRALAVLEYAATPEAKKCLQTLSGGIPKVRLTREAKAALERLRHRSSTAP
ncbi:MAG: WD40 repeat domain-containing protein, partial [Gemmataceae bacterium]